MRKNSVNFINLIGKEFGRLIVKERANINSKRTYWECICKCGNIKVVDGAELKRGSVRSCGCYRNEVNGTHRKSKTHIYMLWHKMKDRCLNSNNKDYPNYGGRGIVLCTEWKSFDIFYNWAINNGYYDGLSIERVDVNMGYTPSNCIWIEMSQQSKNRRANILLTYEGKTQIISDWARELKIPAPTLYSRYHRNLSIEKILSKTNKNERPQKGSFFYGGNHEYIQSN